MPAYASEVSETHIANIDLAIDECNSDLDFRASRTTEGYRSLKVLMQDEGFAYGGALAASLAQGFGRWEFCELASRDVYAAAAGARGRLDFAIMAGDG